MKDYATKERKAFINGEPPTNEQKLARAKQQLGTKYLCHEANRVKRAPHRTPDIQKTDVTKTFARVRKANGFDLV